MPDNISIQDELINQIVNRLRKIGFLHVNKKNIITDEVYSHFFSKILNEKLGENQELDMVINQLLTSLNLKNEIH